MTTQSDDLPQTLAECIRYFSDPQLCHDYLRTMRWPDGVTCPHCARKGVESRDLGFYTNRRLWRCQTCKKQFSVKVGMVFESSPLPLEKWLPCMWLIINAKNGISSYEIHRALGVTQKTAWFMLHRLRAALKSKTQKLCGVTEADEAFIGGASKNMRKRKREERGIKRGGAGKSIVMGLLERTTRKAASKVRAMTIRTTDKANIHRETTGTSARARRSIPINSSPIRVSRNPVISIGSLTTPLNT